MRKRGIVMKTGKRILALLMVLALLVSAVPSTVFAAEPGENGAAAQSVTDITLWTYPVGGWSDEAAVAELIAQFEEEHPDINVDVTILDYETGDDNVADAIANGTTPDLILEGPERVVKEWGHHMIDLSDMLDKGDLAEIDSNVLAACYGGNGLSMYPFSGVVHTMAINKAYFEDAGAMQYLDEETRTWNSAEDFFRAVQAVYEYTQRTVGVVVSNGMGGDQATRGLVTNLYGGRYTNEEHTAYTWTDGENIAALQALYDLEGIEFAPDMNGGMEISAFRNGELSMSFCWNVAQHREAGGKTDGGDDILVMAYPSDAQPTLQGGIWGFGAFENDDEARAEAAKTFIRWMCDSEATADALRMIGNNSVRSNVKDVWEYDPTSRPFEELMPLMGDYYQISDNWGEARVCWYQMLTDIANGNDIETTVAYWTAVANGEAAPAPDGGDDDGILDVIVPAYSDYTYEWWAQFEEDFEAEHEGIDLALECVSWDEIYGIVEQRLDDGNAPDILTIDSFEPYLDWLLPIDEAMYPETYDKIYANFLEESRFNGTVWAAPDLTSARALYYNADILEEAGISVPTTWAELEAACDAIEDCFGDDVFAWGMDITNDAATTFALYMWSNGGGFVDEYGNWCLNTEANAQALEFAASLHRRDNTVPADLMRYEIQDLFADGRVAMMIAPYGFEGALSGMNYGVANLPANEGKTASSCGVMDRILCFNNGYSDEKLDMIREFFDFFYNDERYGQWVYDEGFLPSTWTGMEWMTEEDDSLAVWSQILPNCKFLPTTKENWWMVRDVLGEVLYLAIEGEDSHLLMEALQEIACYGDGSGGEEQSTEPFLSFRWLDNWGEGWFQNDDWREDGNAWSNGYAYDLSMIPGEESWLVFYLNVWNEETGSFIAAPVHVDVNEYLNADLIADLEHEEIASDAKDGGYFYRIQALENGWDQTGVISYTMGDGTVLTREITMSRGEAGFYSEPVASNMTYLREFRYDRLNPEDAVFYFIFESDYWTLDHVEYGQGYIGIPDMDPSEIYTMERISDNIYQITLDTWAVSTGCSFELALNIFATDPEGNPNDWEWWHGTWCHNNWEQETYDANLGINREGYAVVDNDGEVSIFREKKSGIENTNGDDIWVLEKSSMPEGVSYDLATNTLTLNNAHLETMDLGYGWYDDENETWCHNLPTRDLTIELIGENTIESTRVHGIRFWGGVNATITGDGSLYVRMENSMQRDEWGNCQNFDAIHMSEESTLIVAGNATVTAEIAGQGWESCWDGDEYLGEHPAMAAAIRGNQGSLILKDNATLTTVVPEGARTNGEWIENEEDAIWGDRTPGGYHGINSMLHITVEGGTLNTQELEMEVRWGEEGVDEIGSYTQNGGTVNINPIGSKQKTEQWMWDEELEEDVFLGIVDHYHYNGLGHWEGCDISISGGELNITAVPTEEELASSAHVSAIFTDNGGGVEISGGTVNVNVGAGDAITTKNLTVTGGTLNATNTRGCVLRVHETCTITDGEVNLFGNDHDVVYLDGCDMVMTGGNVTIGSDYSNLMSLGYGEWDENEGGSLTVSGGNLTLNVPNTDVWAIESRHTGKVRFCGDAQVELNGGILAVNGEMTVEDNAYVDINDGRIDINNGGSLTMDGGVIDMDNSWDLDHEDQWPVAFYVDRESRMIVNDGKLSIDGENFDIGIKNDGEFVQNGGEISVKLHGVRYGYFFDERIGEFRIYPSVAVSNSGMMAINGGVMNLNGFRGLRNEYDAGDPENPDWPANPNVYLSINGGVINIDCDYVGLIMLAPGEINGGDVNINISGFYYPEADYTMGHGVYLESNHAEDPNVATCMTINGGNVNVDVVCEGNAGGIFVAEADLNINGGYILVDAQYALWGQGDAEMIHLSEGINIISMTSADRKDLLGRYQALESTDENGEPYTRYRYFQSVEEDNEPGCVVTGEGLDECTSLLITSNSCGEAAWTIEDGVLNISGNGEMADYDSVTDRPWDALRETITAVTVGSEVTYVGTYAFAGMECLSNVSFLGDAPAIADNAFEGIAATAFYPENNNTWTKAVMKNYGGQLTWKPMGKPAVEITTQPADFVGIVGDMATFAVEANREDVTYQWFFSKDGGATWEKSSATSNTLTVEFKAYRLGYLYRCEITDADGNTVVSDAAVLAALELDLEILTQPVSYVGAVNDDVTFTVEATGNGLVYEWFFSDNGGETWAKSYSPGYMTNTLAPILRAYRDGNMYKCVVTDVLGNSVESDAVSMTVKASDIVIVTQPQPVINAISGALYGFSVVAEGDNLTYRWELSTDGGETWQESWNQGYNTPNLSVRMNPNRDGNLYRCAITSGQKLTVYTDAVVLDMQDPSVELIGQSGSLYITAGTTATFTVEAEGMDLTYLWYRSDDKGTTWYQTYLSGYNTNTLSFTAQANRAAMYMCKITDGSGTVVWSSTVKLQVLSEELKILTQPVSATCANGETVTFHVDAQGDSLKYQWYSFDGVEWKMSYLPGYNTDTFSFKVSATRAAKVYKCVITDAAGNTVETDVVSVTIG